MTNNKPLVSSCIITYNQEKFIKNCLHGVINQELDYPYEVVIGNDNSTDSTAKICQEFIENNTNDFRLKNNPDNLGIVKNLKSTLELCKGSYIAICEGDDYWTDKNKLQIQIDFLEQHPQYSACAHQANVIYEDQEIAPHPFNEIVTELDISTGDLIGLRKFHTASLVFRSDILKRQPSLPTNITSSDRALFLLLAAYGPIKFIPKSMCVYRKSNVGISSWVTPHMLRKDFRIIPWIIKHNPSFPKGKYRAYIHKTVFQYPRKIDRITYIKHYLLFAFYSFSYFPSNLRELKSSWPRF